MPDIGQTPKVIVLPNPIVVTSVKFDVNRGSGGWNAGLREFEVYGFDGGAVEMVESIAVSGAGGSDTIDIRRGTLQMAAVLPADTTNQAVAWTVFEEDETTPTSRAAIGAQGLLSAYADGQVRVVATAKDGSGVKGSLLVTLSGQGVDPSMGTNVAPNAAATASSEYNASYAAGNDVDGQTGTE